MANAMEFNALVPPANRLQNCPNQGERRGFAVPTHIILHITGTDTIEPARRRFMTPGADASAHYIVDKDGSLFQLVVDGRRAFHAGIQTVIKTLYDAGDQRWKDVIGLTLPRRTYPADSIFLDANLQPTSVEAKQRFVKTRDGTPWTTRFRYFEDRWGINRNQPWNYENSKLPNDYSIGIEIVSFGATRPSATAYTEAMYATLARLVIDLCAKYEIPRAHGRVIGHEDVHPVDRFGWDPGAGFDWSRVLQS